MAKIKTMLAAGWSRVKRWWILLLIMLGIIAAPIYAAPKDFTWQNATQRMDGTAFPVSELAETRIYCDGDALPVVTVTGSGTSATAEFGIGVHDCFATHVDTIGQESDASNNVTFTILPARPNAPVSFDVSP